MKPRTLFLAALLFIVPAHAAESGAKQGPTVLPQTVHLWANRLEFYWRDPNADGPDEQTWSWLPAGQFEVRGPVPDDGIFEMVFGLPNGKEWVRLPCPTEQINANDTDIIKTEFGTTREDVKKAIPDVGTFPFRILYRQGGEENRTLYSGKATVERWMGRLAKQSPKWQEFVVQNDWNLPIGYLWFDPEDDTAPKLFASTWFRGPNTDHLVGQVLYNGAVLNGTDEDTAAAERDLTICTPADGPGQPRWEKWEFHWGKARAFCKADADARTIYKGDHFLAEHPGDYEIRVLRDGVPVRSIKFTVGADGQIADNGLAKQNHFPAGLFIVPVKILKEDGGKWNPDEWKTGAFYGNGLAGFTAP